MIPYGRQWIDDDDIAAVTAALRGDFLTTGPLVAEFEKKLCEATGAAEAVVCSNGTTALHLAAICAGLGPGDAAVVPSMTFLATANAVRYTGADVIFADVDPQTGLMRISDFENALGRADGRNIKAVFPVHLTGQCADLPAIRKIADGHGITVIADACHALGSTLSGVPVGAGVHEHFSSFSFHPVKTITMGEGGAVTTNDTAMAKRMRRLRHHGMDAAPQIGPWASQMPELGYNYRATDIQCALGVAQLKKLPYFVARRKEIAGQYDAAFAALAPVLQTPVYQAYNDPALHLYAVRIDFATLGMDRAQMMAALKDQGIGTQVHYMPVHTQPYYQGLYGAQPLPGAQHYYEHTLSLPLYPAMSDDDVATVIRGVTDLIQGVSHDRAKDSHIRKA